MKEKKYISKFETDRETVGKISGDLMQKVPESRDPIEIQRETQKDLLNVILDCITKDRHRYTSDFFVVLVVKKERLMPNVYRNYVFSRQSCPTPDYDQSVFHYQRDKEEVNYLWTVPDKQTCLHMKTHMMEVQEKDLLGFVLDFYDGTLLRRAKKFNNERDDSNILLDAKGLPLWMN